jgi:predicted ATPase/class 3 adenylate cyclase
MPAMTERRELPSGTVTFLFTDIQGSTRLAHDLGTDRWHEVLAHHGPIVRDALAKHAGFEVRTEGDSFFLVFRTAREAVAAAADAQRALVTHEWPQGATVKVRMGMHAGEAVPASTEAGTDYVGYAVHHAARVGAAGHGGQVLLTNAVRSLLEDKLPEGVTLRDLGQHRLRDMSEPDRLYQLVIDGIECDFPPLRTLEQAPHNLPVQATSFVGRDHEIAEARRLLERVRLLALTGPGGTGKTRLSLQLAAEVIHQFPDGVWFVRLAPVRDPDLVPSAIVQALGLQVAGKTQPIELLVEHLKAKRVLLLLDNFEQVVGASQYVSRILAEAPEVKIVVTTRAVLRVYGEQEYPVPPLELPDPKHPPSPAKLSMYEAVRLFIERAIAAKPDFAVTNENAPAVAGIVARLDGLPLAIELAAARVRILPPQAIHARLGKSLDLLQSGARDLPERQRTLRGAISWSYDLLDDAQKRVFRRMSAFLGGAGLDEIERVAGSDGEPGGDVLDWLSALVDQSLLRQQEQRGEPRFLMLEVIREYAREQLDTSGEAADIDARHIAVYLALAERARPELRSVRQKDWLDRLDLEHGNLRAAFDRAVAAGRVEEALRLVYALWRYWQMRGHLMEGRRRAEQALALPGARDRTLAYARAVEAAGSIAYWQGDSDAALRWYTEALELARAIGDPALVANALYNHSFSYFIMSGGREPDIERAISSAQEALSIYRRLGDKAGTANVLWGIAGAYTQQGEFDKGISFFDEALALYRQTEDQFGLIWALRSSGLNLLKQGRVDESRARMQESLRLLVEAGDQSGIAILLSDLAEVARAEGDVLRTQRLRGASEMMVAQSGSALVRLADQIDKRVQDIATEEERAAFTEGTEMTVGEAVSYALGRHGRVGPAPVAAESATGAGSATE